MKIRHLDRMRMGMALAGLLFCMTSSALAMSSGHKTTVPATDTDNLASICNVNLKDDGSLQLFQSIDAKIPSLVLRYYQGADFDRLNAAISAATVVPNGHGKPIQSIVFYERTGQTDKLLALTDTNLLYDAASSHYFRPNSMVLAYLAEHTPK